MKIEIVAENASVFLECEELRWHLKSQLFF